MRRTFPFGHNIKTHQCPYPFICQNLHSPSSIIPKKMLHFEIERSASLVPAMPG
jgi:hypothetical protein